MLELVGLHRRYGDTLALDGLTVSIPAGVVFGLLGPNGSGKTTSMRATMGVTSVDSGEIRWEGRVVTREDRLRFGYMPEERALYPDMFVAEHLIYFARLHGATKAEAEARAAEWLDRLNLTERANDKIADLSQGNKQRVQVANTLIHQPDLMLMDEPFSGLDPVGIGFLSDVLSERAAEGATVVFSSHQLDVVESLCSQVAIVHKGRLVSAGATREVTAPKGDRLCLEVRGARRGWERRLKGVKVLSKQDGRLDLELLPGHDPSAVLDQARRAGEVTEFSQVRRKLSEVFLDAVGALPHEVEEAVEE
ncbi:MAG TPA: ATP-binding cassette domain-containing protein [Acidimicrobiales bacterium]|nr:ATP-binding cassette domain-containing protein [Acidimicrobiales bacterium]